MRRRGAAPPSHSATGVAAIASRLLPAIANTLWYLACLPAGLAFHRARRDVAGTQRRLLLDLLHRNADSAFGRQHDFASIRSVEAYQARVPLSTYDDYRAAIQQIGAGHTCILTHDPVELLEPTSGTTAPTKYIPYTKALQFEFQRGIAPWIVDLYSHIPCLLTGQAYWSLSPVTQRNERTPSGIPVGFADDSAYLGFVQRRLVQSLFAVPPLVRLIDEMQAFRYVTLLFLLRSRTLTLISVWNPTFLTLLVARLADWWPRLVADIAEGTLSPPTPLAPDLLARLRPLNRPAPQRAAEVQSAFAAGGDPGAMHARLWPNLRLVSCWTDGNAARYAADLARLFPQAVIQGKGLIATEGFVSFPLVGHSGAVLAVRSHFFEFLPVTAAGEPEDQSPHLAHQLETGKTYAVIITTGGGLYRYQLHDIITVVGYLGTCPCLRFVGKAANVSDWFGEKVSEQHVRQVLDTLLARYRLHPGFVMLACDERDGRPAYTLFIEIVGQPDDTLRALGTDIEAALRENYHYRYCRDLGQLDALRIFRITGGALETYLATCQAHGQRAGDIKPVVLHRAGGWSQHFAGYILAPPEVC